MRLPELLKSIESLPAVMHLEIDGKRYKKTCQYTFSPGLDSKSITGELLDNLSVPLAILDEEYQALYQFSNGMKLFHSETENDDSGKYFIPSVVIYPLDRLALETECMQSRVLEAMDVGDESPIYFEGLVIGEAAGTGNPFVVIRSGALAGKIVYADHDPDINNWHDKPFAESLTAFLSQIAIPPHAGLCHLYGADRIWFE